MVRWNQQPVFVRRRLRLPIAITNISAAVLLVYLAAIEFVFPSHNPGNVECMFAYAALGAVVLSQVIYMMRRHALRKYVMRCQYSLCGHCGYQLIEGQERCPECGIVVQDVRGTWKRWLGTRID